MKSFKKNFKKIRKPITKVSVNFEINLWKNFETFKTFLGILNYEKKFFNYDFNFRGL